MPISPLYQLLKELDDLDAKRAEGPWWQKSWMCESAPPGAKRELSDLLCCFADEDGPRFWNYEGDGQFVVKLENAWPLIRAELRKSLGIDE